MKRRLVMKKIMSILVILLVLVAVVGCGPQVNYEKGKVRLARIPSAGMVGGVCAGLAYWTETPTFLWRVGAVLTSETSIYFWLWLLMPVYNQTPDDFEARTS
jgi:phage shock protein PspC (stress-responsive transcriptional regulator)